MIRIADGGMPWVLASFAFTFLFLGAFFLTSGAVSIFLFLVSVFFFLISCLLVVFFRAHERSIGVGIFAVADGKIR